MRYLLFIFLFFPYTVFAVGSYIFLNVPNGAQADKLYQDHTYAYYIYTSHDFICLPPQERNHLLQLGQYYEDENGKYERTRLLEDIDPYVGEINCIKLVVSSGHPGFVKRTSKLDGEYITKTAYLLSSDNDTSLNFPWDFVKVS